MQRGTPLTKSDATLGKYPVISGGKEPAFYCNKYNRCDETITIAGSGAGAGYAQYWNTNIFVCDAFSIKPQTGLLTKYLFYCLSRMQEKIYATKKGGGVPHVHIADIENFIIPLPPLERQKEIVEQLDNFDKMVNDLRAGLPAEIAARTRQHEYYRDKLLTFKRKS